MEKLQTTPICFVASMRSQFDYDFSLTKAPNKQNQLFRISSKPEASTLLLFSSSSFGLNLSLSFSIVCSPTILCVRLLGRRKQFSFLIQTINISVINRFLFEKGHLYFSLCDLNERFGCTSTNAYAFIQFVLFKLEFNVEQRLVRSPSRVLMQRISTFGGSKSTQTTIQ